MIIRSLTREDAHMFRTLRLFGLAESPTSFSSSVQEVESQPISEIERRLVATEENVCFGAFDGRAQVGITGVERESHIKLRHKAWVWGVYVAPNHRRTGVGRQLMEHAIAYAKTMPGLRQLNLGVNAANAPAKSLYESLGFREFGLEKDYLFFDGQFHDERLMVLKLD